MSIKPDDHDSSNFLRTAEAIQWLEPFRDFSIAQFIDKFFDDLCASTRERGRKLMSQFAEDATLDLNGQESYETAGATKNATSPSCNHSTPQRTGVN